MMPQAGFGESILFLSIGALIAQNKEKIVSYARKNSAALKILLSVLTVLLIAESIITMSQKAFDGNCYLSLIFLPAVLFVFALSFDPIRIDTGRIGEMSLYIYLIHPILKSLMWLTEANSIVRTLVCVIVSVVLSYIITGKRNGYCS